MSGILKLARQELTSLPPYVPGAYEPGYIRLNANESPWKAPGDPTERGLNIYPPPRPDSITQRLSEQYAVPAKALLVTRGTSEAIDVLIRGFCTAGRDQILICPPTFDMYRLYAGIQGADVLSVPLLRDRDPDRDFTLDVSRMIANSSERMLSDIRSASIRAEDINANDSDDDLAAEDLNGNGRIDDDWSLADGETASEISFNMVAANGLYTDKITYRFDGEHLRRDLGSNPATVKTTVVSSDVTAVTFTRQGRRIIINVVIESGVVRTSETEQDRGGRQVSLVREILLRN